MGNREKKLPLPFSAHFVSGVNAKLSFLEKEAYQKKDSSCCIYMLRCFYDCDFVNTFVDRRILRAACGRTFLFNKDMKLANRYKTNTNRSSFEGVLPKQSGSL
jgi:hypothetical protein